MHKYKINYNDLTKDKTDKNKITKSERYNLLKRGSVLYVGDGAKYSNIKELLKSQSAFRNIGYNQFITI